MNKNDNIMTKVQFIILLLWVSFTVLAFGYFISEKLVSFDTNNKLSNLEHSDISTHLAPYLNNDSTSTNNTSHTVLHFSQPNCACQQYSEQHVQDINKIATKNGFAIKNVVISEDSIIPSTPAIALIDNSGALIYFGPYGQGVACSQTSGYAQTMLNNHVKGYTANVVIKAAKGCYCAV